MIQLFVYIKELRHVAQPRFANYRKATISAIASAILKCRKKHSPLLEYPNN